LVGVFLAIIAVVGYIERQIPLSLTVPGVHLGLSNAVILLSLYLFRPCTSLCLALLKCALMAALAGGMSSFLYSLSGSMLSFLAMWLLLKWVKAPVAVSAAGATLHVVGQYLAAAAVIHNASLLAMLPVPALLGAASGVLTGVLVKCALPKIRALRIQSNRRPPQ
jgi:heptaprenyl diphosphate synthase